MARSTLQGRNPLVKGWKTWNIFSRKPAVSKQADNFMPFQLMGTEIWAHRWTGGCENYGVHPWSGGRNWGGISSVAGPQQTPKPPRFSWTVSEAGPPGSRSIVDCNGGEGWSASRFCSLPGCEVKLNPSLIKELVLRQATDFHECHTVYKF